MRLSNALIFQTGAKNIQQLQQNIFQLHNQMSTDRRIVTPADDPVGAAQALVTRQQLSISEQFVDNQGNAQGQLASLESQLGSVTNLLTRVVELGGQAKTKYSNGQRALLAPEIRESFDQLLGLANASNGMGLNLFSGYRADVTPFSVTGGAGNRIINYHGDEGNRQLQVNTSRVMNVSESGADVFMRIPQGRAGMVATAGGSNTGTGVLSSPSPITAYDGTTYQLVFTSATTYDLSVTPPGGGTTTTPGTYTAGSDIVLANGTSQIKIAITGTPANGDSFSVTPATNQSVFETIDNLIAELENPIGSSPADQAAYDNRLRLVMENLGQALDHLISKRAQVGARQNELDALSIAGSDRVQQYTEELSALQDVDYVQAISDFTNYKTILEAAQSTFAQTSKMSLFSYL